MDTVDSRNAEKNPDRHAAYVAGLVDGLARLEMKTRPSQGNPTAKDKDLHVQDALSLARQLVAAVAGWAIDHQVGLAFHELENLPPQIGGLNSPAKREYASRKAKVDQHEHERDGALIDFDQDDSLFARRCLRFLLQQNQAGLPPWLSEMTLSGLQALDYGDETPPMFERNTNGRKNSEQIREYQLRALAFIEYRKEALGLTKTVSEGDIADALDVKVDTIKGWRKDLPKVFGAYKVGMWLAEAKNSGSAHNLKSTKKSKLPAEDLAILRSLADNRYGKTALLVLANQYRTASNKPLLTKLGE
jgi:hypothetical protein